MSHILMGLQTLAYALSEIILVLKILWLDMLIPTMLDTSIKEDLLLATHLLWPKDHLVGDLPCNPQ